MITGWMRHTQNNLSNERRSDKSDKHSATIRASDSSKDRQVGMELIQSKEVIRKVQ
jgi:hypothetical protein